MTDTKTPPDAKEAAQARLSDLRSDPSFIERYLKGEDAAVEEMTAVHQKLAPDSQTDTSGRFAREAQLATLKRFAHIDDAAAKQVIEGGPVYPHEREEAVQLKARLFRDQDFCTKYLAGDHEAATILTRVNLILSSPVRKDEPNKS